MGQELLTLSQELEQHFRHWEHYRANGGSDPFWPDGFNLNLIRNHIIYTKNQIRDLIERQQSRELSLFPPAYPDIWHKETPPEVPNDLMVKADEIRSHAKKQLNLFLADPNFQYLMQQAKLLYPRGQTRETKEAGLPYYEVIGLEKYEKAVKDDDLVAMRRDFREPYESIAPRWARYARQIRAHLEHSSDPKTGQSAPISPPEPEKTLPFSPVPRQDPAPTLPRSDLDSRLKDASARSSSAKSEAPRQNEQQLSLF